MTGVYLLFWNKKIIYIGKTERWPLRITEHKFKFNSAKLIECDVENIDSIECRLIEIFKPKHNCRNTHPLLSEAWLVSNLDEIAEASDKWWNKKDLAGLVALGKRAKNELGYSAKTDSKQIGLTIYSKYVKLAEKTAWI